MKHLSFRKLRGFAKRKSPHLAKPAELALCLSEIYRVQRDKVLRYLNGGMRLETLIIALDHCQAIGWPLEKVLAHMPEVRLTHNWQKPAW